MDRGFHCIATSSKKGKTERKYNTILESFEEACRVTSSVN